jgi:hypothetical protein
MSLVSRPPYNSSQEPTQASLRAAQRPIRWSDELARLRLVGRNIG